MSLASGTRRAVVLVAAVVVGAYSLAGYVMAASFTVADPGRLTQHRTAAWIYLALVVGSLIIIGAALRSLWTSRRAP